MHPSIEFQNRLQDIGGKKLLIRQTKRWESDATLLDRLKAFNLQLFRIIGDEMQADRMRDVERDVERTMRARNR